MDVSKIESAIKSLTPGQKYHLLKHQFKPDATFVFPTTEMSGFNRSFQYAWLKRFPWLVYSKSLDGGFCLPCALFAKNRQSLRVLVNNPFIKWIKLEEKVDSHKDKQYHRNAQIDADQFLYSVEHPEGTLPVMTECEREKRIQVKPHIVRCIAEGVLYCGRQCIALRGDHESLKTQGNPGNCLALLMVLGRHDKILQEHLEHPAMRNATYLSPDSQNKIIDIIGKQMIRQPILDEVKRAKFFSIMVDEVTAHNKEQMPLCVRFVDGNRNIREEFLQFTNPLKLTWEALTHDIMTSTEDLGLDIKNIRGQGYDGAANISGGRVGVQAGIRQESLWQCTCTAVGTA